MLVPFLDLIIIRGIILKFQIAGITLKLNIVPKFENKRGYLQDNLELLNNLMPNSNKLFVANLSSGVFHYN